MGNTGSDLSSADVFPVGVVTKLNILKYMNPQMVYSMQHSPNLLGYGALLLRCILGRPHVRTRETTVVKELYLAGKLNKHNMLLNGSKGTLGSCNTSVWVIFMNLRYM